MQELWGSKVKIEIPPSVFPSPQKISELDDLFHNPTHGFFPSTFEQQKLHYRKYLPAQKPKAIVIWQHGIHGHSGYGMKRSTGQYTNLALRARMYIKAGIALYCCDQLGHGFSEGARFVIPNGDWNINVQDLISFTKFAASEHEDDIPLFVSGDSYGACLAIHAGRHFQNVPQDAPKAFVGLVLNAPAIVPDLPPAPVVFLLRYALAPLFPTWTPFFMPNPVSADRIWKDEEPRKYFSDDDKMYGLSNSGRPFCLATATGCLEAVETLQAKVIPGFNVPFSINHGDCDYSIKLSGSEFMMQHSETKEGDKVLNVIQGGYHDLYSGLDAEEIESKQIEWILTRIS